MNKKHYISNFIQVEGEKQKIQHDNIPPNMDEVYGHSLHSKVPPEAGLVSSRVEDKNKQIMISKCKIIIYYCYMINSLKSSSF